LASNESLVARRQAAVARGVSMVHPVFIERAENALLWDVEGRRYVDFAGGIAVLNNWVKTLIARADIVQFDAQMLAMAVGLSLLAGLVAGLYPAWRVCRIAPAIHLKVQ